jgi:uncharacterized membrane protein YphA (DoxX/SURF4 family)
MYTWFTPEAMAGLFIRVFTGILFFFQGYDKIFRLGLKEVFNTVAPSYRKAGLGDGMIKLFSGVTAWIELLGGLLLILGLLKYIALYALGIDLLIVALGMSILNPMWDMQHVFPRLLLILFLLVFPSSLDIIGIDHFIF